MTRVSSDENAPVVFIIVLTWNGKTDTLECLESLHQIDVPHPTVILVDNASTDGTVAAVRKQFPQVEVIENRSNLGFAEGNNVGMRYAIEQGAEYIFLLNNDAVVLPNTLSQLVQVAESNSEIGILCPGIVSYFDHSKHYVGAKIYWGAGACADIERKPDGLPRILDTEYAPGCALLIKSRVVRQIGLFDPDFFAYIEDVDWSLRCASAGYGVVVVPQATIYHKGAMDQSYAKSPAAEYYFRRNQFLFMRKHGKWYHWPSFIKYYVRKSLERFQFLIQSGDSMKAEATLDGWWAGVTGRYGGEQSQAPGWFKKLIHDRLNALMWLTGWLYFWDYQKVNRRRAKEAKVSV